MRVAGVILIVIAVILFVGGISMDTSVPTGLGGRVNNLGLMHDQEIAIVVAVGLFIGGAILVGFGQKTQTTPINGNAPTALSSADFSPDRLSKKCPACAESIKLEALVCRFCGHKFEQAEVEAAIQKAKAEFEAQQPNEHWSEEQLLSKWKETGDTELAQQLRNRGYYIP